MDTPSPPEDPGGPTPPGDRLDSWKEIAAHLGRGVTTVQRWEQEQGLPVHRLPHAKRGSVYAYRRELDDWLTERTRMAISMSPAAAPAAAPASAPRRWGHPLVAIGTGCALLALIAIAWPLVGATGANRVAPPASAPTLPVLTRRPLLPDPSSETRAPSLAPDGREVAFVLSEGHAAGVYVAGVTGGTPRLLWRFDPETQAVYTTKWSPDGRWIAFTSYEGHDTYGLYVTAPAGGAPTYLTSTAGVGICWTPDSQAVTFADRTSTSEPFSLFTMALSSHERQRLTHPPDGSFGDTACAWSPDGQDLAMVRFSTRYEAAIVVAPHGDDTHARALTSGTTGSEDVEWTPDGGGLLFTQFDGLRRIDLSSPVGPGRVVPGLDGQARRASFSRTTTAQAALAYETGRRRFGAWFWSAGSPASPRSWLPPDAENELPAMTRDGALVAYVKGREIWTASIDGTNHRRLTFQAGATDNRILTDPAWSPDGTRVAYSVPVDGHRDIYVIDADGSHSTRLTSDPSIEDNPTWSSDGRWIYFRSDRDGTNHVWKMPSTGGVATRVTRGEAWRAEESQDGSTLYFVRGATHAGLWAMPLPGGREELVVPEVTDGHWGVAASDVVYLEPGPDAATSLVRAWSIAGHHSRTLASVPAAGTVGFAVSSRGDRVLWMRAMSLSRAVMLVDGWRR